MKREKRLQISIETEPSVSISMRQIGEANILVIKYSAAAAAAVAG